MTKYTNREVAENWELWQEYFDISSEMTREDFDALSVDEREAMIEKAFGTDAQQVEQSA